MHSPSSPIAYLTFQQGETFAKAYQKHLKRDGICVIQNAISPECMTAFHTLAATISEVDTKYQKGNQLFAVRNLLTHAPELLPILEMLPLHQLTQPFFDSRVSIIKAIYFDKPSEANWKVPWHQDTTIAVQSKIETTGFQNWTYKENIPNVRPPIEILENILTLRIHLDSTDENNGALRIIPASHLNGFSNKTDIESAYSQKQPVTCSVQEGDIIAMRPLLLHASSTSNFPSQRRVIHLEFSTDTLPNGLNWHGT